MKQYVGTPEKFYFFTYRLITNSRRYISLGPVTTQTYAWKVLPIPATEDPFHDDMPPLSDGWEITFDVICLDEVGTEEEIPQEEKPKEPEPEAEKEERVSEEIEESEAQIIETPIIKKKNIFHKVIKKVKSIVSNIQDVFTWNIEFSEINWNIFLPKQEDMQLNKKEDEIEEIKNKPFRFPFNKIIGVTQWHGNTAFQKPHTGIDFGATKEEVISPEDGKVVALGWDSFKGECFSGGNYLVIEHTNGIHTAYFHIEKYFVKLGDNINKGERLAITGNSGKWNCQNLAYHLHFETRKERDQNTHVNPVDYIDIDWDTVPTLGYKYNSGRLSGENPHPTF